MYLYASLLALFFLFSHRLIKKKKNLLHTVTVEVQAAVKRLDTFLQACVSDSLTLVDYN